MDFRNVTEARWIGLGINALVLSRARHARRAYECIRIEDCRADVMKVLLLAYEFPPVESAHGLRWGYLTRELGVRGHQVSVLSAAVLGNAASRCEYPNVSVFYAFPGPFVGATGRLSSFLRRRQGDETKGLDGVARPASTGGLERLYRFLRGLGNQLLVPDIRSEWLPWALRAAFRMIEADRPDVIIASHEPGVDLALARRLRRRYAIPVVADLGDPVVSPYTPRWRRWLDAMFERRWLDDVSAVSVTTEGTRELLRSRLTRLRNVNVEVLPQGFDDREPVGQCALGFDTGQLELLYTGTLYARFRDPSPLLEALGMVDGVRLTIAGYLDGIEPESLQRCASVRYVGRLPHEQVKAAQRRADVLVNIGNDFDVQVPGKIFEYLGAGRPILHVARNERDVSIGLLEELQCGVAVHAADIDGIVRALQRLKSRKREGCLPKVDPSRVEAYSWQSIGGRLEKLLLGVVGRANGNGECDSVDAKGASVQ